MGDKESNIQIYFVFLYYTSNAYLLLLYVPIYSEKNKQNWTMNYKTFDWNLCWEKDSEKDYSIFPVL